LDINPAVRLAIAEGQSGALDALLRKGPALFKFLEKFATDYSESDGLRTIIQAVELDDGATLDKLRLAGVRLGPFDQLGGAIQPLGTACSRGHAAAARAILKDPAVVQWVLARKSDAIMRACNKGSAPTLAALLERVEITHTRETPTIDVFQDTTPLMRAVISDDVATVELVLDQGVDINENRPSKKTPLSIAASKHSLEVTSLLLKRGATLQHPAGSYASGEISCAFKYLLSDNAFNYEESLSLAMVQLFLRERPHDRLPDRLVEFTRTNWLRNSILQKLLAAGADASASDEYGLTPLHVCVYNAVATSQHNCDYYEVYKCIDTLVMARASLDAVTTRDVTEDHMALFGHSLPRGLTPMGVARTCGSEDRRDAAVAHLTAAIAMRAL
jgi:ankyrin repeat protein